MKEERNDEEEGEEEEEEEDEEEESEAKEEDADYELEKKNKKNKTTHTAPDESAKEQWLFVTLPCFIYDVFTWVYIQTFWMIDENLLVLQHWMVWNLRTDEWMNENEKLLKSYVSF